MLKYIIKELLNFTLLYEEVNYIDKIENRTEKIKIEYEDFTQ